ncbi:rRNA maturation RNase YbeY [Conexibacter sp. JD483]|uniref:rRNA maturation RNase YbeY n=1 Tax=unclassified Conexibacter TaxID=2627773 RepID=UPI00271EC403|nr:MULTISPECIES: rRNA maturation RNase YbeY [unclassified Conexibacter]MDO8184798.1 rRNA maturation RNase YbeY [Conexibacter sp. CPCC 205706]MDO8196573.1 rRNA maturation RNase YbeY [Conexibacter sp. CPCC 205762]MDR9368714.1 rRNA maturation RNase YbeY [Conexibacter sp. JD483]
MLEVEVIGLDDAEIDGLTAIDVEELCGLAFSSAGIEDGHVAVAFVDPETIRVLNRDHRGKDKPTDVLSFPIDGEDGWEQVPPDQRELGDVVICPPHTEDLSEAVVHGALHLTGMDHEVDDGEMLALQAELLRWVRP